MGGDDASHRRGHYGTRRRFRSQTSAKGGADPDYDHSNPAEEGGCARQGIRASRPFDRKGPAREGGRFGQEPGLEVQRVRDARRTVPH